MGGSRKLPTQSAHAGDSSKQERGSGQRFSGPLQQADCSPDAFCRSLGRSLADRVEPMGKNGGSQAAAPAATESAMPPPSSLTVAQPAQSSKTEGLETEVGRLNAENELLKKRLYDSQDEVRARGFRSHPCSGPGPSPNPAPLGTPLCGVERRVSWLRRKSERRLTAAPPPHFQVNRLKGMIENQDKKSFKSDSDSQSTGNSTKKSQSRWDAPLFRWTATVCTLCSPTKSFTNSFSPFFCLRLAHTHTQKQAPPCPSSARKHDGMPSGLLRSPLPVHQDVRGWGPSFAGAAA
jgi:hypothetical protein